MSEYTGPIPKTPSAGTTNEPASTLAEWQLWIDYQGVEATFARARADLKVAEAGKANADALRDLANPPAGSIAAANHKQQIDAATKLAEALHAVASALKPAATPSPAPVPLPVPAPDPVTLPDPATGLLADAFAVVRRLVAAYKAPTA